MSDSNIVPVGVDWGNGFHRVCHVDAAGNPAKQAKFLHTAGDIAKLIDWLHALSPQDRGRVHIGVETNRGTLVEALVLQGFCVFAINPKQTDRLRDRYSPSGAKDDRRDAFVLANAIRTDLHCFRQVELDSSEILLLREITRDLEQTKADLGISANRLWEQLHRYYAPLLLLCNGADEPWLWELLTHAPTPDRGRKLPRNTVRKVLRHHSIRRLTAEEVSETLKSEPLPVAPGVADISARTVGLLIARLQLLHSQRLQLERQQKELLAQLETASASDTLPPPSADTPDPDDSAASEAGAQQESAKPARPSDAAILRSLPGVGVVVSSALLSEAAGLLAERDLKGLRGMTGVAAVTRQSGKSTQVMMRRSCSVRLRNAMHYWASVSIQCDAHMRAIYDRMRAAGKGYARALRGLGEHLLRILVAALRSGTLYDKARWPENQAAPA